MDSYIAKEWSCATISLRFMVAWWALANLAQFHSHV